MRHIADNYSHIASIACSASDLPVMIRESLLGLVVLKPATITRIGLLGINMIEISNLQPIWQ